ncbi:MULTISPECIES: response regulator transcription factor [unclassified Rhizobium]|uniref:response regulator transcription factor n=1 Tax=unclassified Rhizobium TaxID=2613769 RepID=UPI00135C7BF9|nr:MULTISPECIES: helix-turn-helix transcriptional regulator [unclassified Rhizobium]
MPHSMPSPEVAALTYPDLNSRPKYRNFRHHPLIERTRLAVAFENVMISGLDIAEFDYASCRSIDSDLPPTFVYTYVEEELFLEDPFITALPVEGTVVTENEVYQRCRPSRRLAQVLDRHNIHNRTYFLLRRKDYVYGAVGFTRAEAFSREEIEYLSMVSPPLHQAFTKPVMDRFAADNLRLSSGELECLRMASMGLTTDEISIATGFQKNTINTYFQLASKKLYATNRSQAIAEALRRHLID